MHSENLGSDFLLHLEVIGCNDRIVVRTEASRAATWQIGSIVPISLPLDALLVFDADDYSVAFLERAAAVALDAGVVALETGG